VPAGIRTRDLGLREPPLCEQDQRVDSVCDPNGTNCLEVAKGILIPAAEERDIDWGEAEKLAGAWLAETNEHARVSGVGGGRVCGDGAG
jgi:hypothetical protein